MSMKQQTLAMAADQGSGFEHYRKPTRRDEFVKTMQAIVPWAALCEVIEPHYPKAGTSLLRQQENLVSHLTHIDSQGR